MTQVDPAIISALQPAAINAADLLSLPAYKDAVEKTIPGARTEKGRIAREGWRIREDLGPIAFDGDPATATVLLLKANPSYGDGATRESHFEPHPDWPLSVAGPHVTAGTRAYYQNGVFGTLRRAGVTLEQISRRMLKVELCPWASKKWPTGQQHLLQQMARFPSRSPTLELVSQLVDQGVLVLIARAEEEWFAGVPALQDLVGTRVFVSRTKIAPAISERMYPGRWPLVLKALRS
ncbi:hypothetical protein LJR290_007491 [Variovorax sp. LjRoot290]|uniref:hypothetical protein n=1 Tax=Variovorax sp. LjRoot290 TaxID=3342316 RepID=UPI003ECCD2D6